MCCRKENGLPRRFAPRNDMQKIGACPRLPVGTAGVQPKTFLPSRTATRLLHVIASLQPQQRLCLLHVIANHRLATAETLQSFACHCEERGGCTATWQSVPLRQHKTESNT